jgi:hypothetical protein
MFVTKAQIKHEYVLGLIVHQLDVFETFRELSTVPKISKFEGYSELLQSTSVVVALLSDRC